MSSLRIASLVVLAAATAGLAACSRTTPNGSGSDASTSSSSSSLGATSGPLRLVDVLKDPRAFANKTVDVVIVEPLRGPGTPEQLRIATHGQVSVDLVDHRGNDVALVPKGWREGNPGRYTAKFDRVITGPVHVVGELLEDRELSRKDHPSWVIVVSTIEPAKIDSPVVVTSAADLPKYDRRAVVYEGVYTSGFEVSTIDKTIWLAASAGAQIINAPPARAGRLSLRVRVTGIAFAQPGERYGHLGSGAAEILASTIEYLEAPDAGPVLDASPDASSTHR